MYTQAHFLKLCHYFTLVLWCKCSWKLNILIYSNHFSCSICFIFTGMNNCLFFYVFITYLTPFSYVNLLSVCSNTYRDSTTFIFMNKTLSQRLLTCFSLNGFSLVLQQERNLFPPSSWWLPSSLLLTWISCILSSMPSFSL